MAKLFAFLRSAVALSAGSYCMNDISPRAWAHTPRNTIARTVHLLDAWGDVFCKHDIGSRRGITFERFLEAPKYHLTLAEEVYT